MVEKESGPLAASGRNAVVLAIVTAWAPVPSVDNLKLQDAAAYTGCTSTSPVLVLVLLVRLLRICDSLFCTKSTQLTSAHARVELAAFRSQSPSS
ncbi:hypothetical protein F4604DRAFT_1711620 [Suillus subluteus]|nr:hypothetical protein F4604DRAFT_1711620 [Suillus subluteus]